MSGEIGNIKEQSISQVSKPKSILHETTKSVCPSCSHENDSSALFCEECGSALKLPAKCPKCGATARPHADICEVCGTWVLKGQCKFCYAHVDDDETFCGECGNPADGIVCPRCGQLSIFDFCKSCGIPLSIQAKEMAKETVNDPTFQKISLLFEELTREDAAYFTTNKFALSETNPVTVASPKDDQISRLRSYRESLSKSGTNDTPKAAPKALFSSDQKEQINRLNDEILNSEEWRKIEEERKRREEEERQRKLQEQFNNAMRKLSGKTFSSNQEARRFFMNIIAGLPEEVARKITDRGMSWRCNAFGCVHNSPSECGDPSRGGVWLLR